MRSDEPIVYVMTCVILHVGVAWHCSAFYRIASTRHLTRCKNQPFSSFFLDIVLYFDGASLAAIIRFVVDAMRCPAASAASQDCGQSLTRLGPAKRVAH